MKHRLPILTVVGAVAAIWLGMLADFGARHWMQTSSATPVAAAGAGSGSSQQAERLVHQAAERLDQYSSISAKIRLKADIFDEQIVGSGQYRQGPAASHLLRWDTKLQIGERLATVQQVSDGTSLWMYQGLQGREEKSTLRRVELAPLLAQEKLSAAQAAAASIPHGLGLGTIGGLPKLLRNLDLMVDFSSLAQAKLPGRFSPRGAELPVYVARGTWTPATWAKLLPDQAAEIKAGQPPKLKKQPRQVPDQVVVALGRDDWFPYRIEFLRTTGDATESLFVAELYDVRWNVPLDPSLFIYKPGIPITEYTGPYIINLFAP